MNIAETDHRLIITLLVVSISFAIALYSDLKSQRIPNKLCLSVLLIGIVFQFYFYQLDGFLNILVNLIVPFAILFPLFYLRALGGGDIKFMIAIGPLLTFDILLWSLAYSVIFGGITTILFIIHRVGLSGIKKTLTRYYQCILLKTYFKPEAGEAAFLRVPYAPALALGWLWTCSQNDNVLWAISNARYALLS